MHSRTNKVAFYTHTINQDTIKNPGKWYNSFIFCVYKQKSFIHCAITPDDTSLLLTDFI